MAIDYVEIKIPEDVYSRSEQFVSLAADFEIGNVGTVRIGSYSFRDGDPIYLHINGTKIRRDKGFRQPLVVTNSNQDQRVYFFTGCIWVQQTTTVEHSVSGLARRVAQLGFWFGLHEWACDVGEYYLRTGP